MTTKISGTDGIDVAQIRAADGDPVAIAISGAGVVSFPVGEKKPIFSATQNAAQSLTSSASKLLFQVEEFDPLNLFASSRFQPNVPGVYRISGGLQVSGNTSSIFLAAYLNGVVSKYLTSVAITAGSLLSSPIIAGSCLIYLNGTTDYVELWGASNSTLNTAAIGSTCYFQASYEGSA